MDETQPLLIRFGGFELDEANARLRRSAKALQLPPRAFAVLCELARRPGQLVTKTALLDAVWGHRHVGDSVLKTAVRQLRAAFEDDAKTPRFIETASRRGYRFIALAEAGAGPSLEPVDEHPGRAGSPAAAPRPAAATVATALAPASPGWASGAVWMTGRGAALARLRAAWDRACAGQRRLCWLAGEAGIGKTTLVDHFAATLGPAASMRALIARGQCVEQHGPGEPYLPVLEALATLCREDLALVALLRSVAPTWLLQLPWLCSDVEREALRRELAGTRQDRMLREFGELLDRYTQDRPLLLVIEDLHWSDQATITLIDHVARRRGRACWMWLATFRTAEVGAEGHPMRALRHELRLHGLCEEIALEPFSEPELADYVARRLGGADESDAFVRALYGHTDGLPLFVANVVDELLAQGALQPGAPTRDPHSLAVLAVPESLAGVMERQITRLPPEQTTLLEVASACGVEFRPAVVAKVLARDADWVARQCDMLASRQQWLASIKVERAADGDLHGRYAFRHALVRHVFHDRMSELTRARLHHRVASVLADAATADATVSPAEIATQFEMGQDPDAALPHCAAAAAAALQQFAPVDALSLADRGLALARRCRPGDAVQNQLATLHTLQGAGAALVHGVSAEQTLQSFEQAQAVLECRPLHPLRSMALHGLGLGLYLRGNVRQAVELAERNRLQALQRDDPVLLVTACDLLGQVIKREGPLDKAIGVLEQGLEAASTLDEQTLQTAFVLDPIVNMHAALAIPLLLAGFDQRSRAQSDLALARARTLGQPLARLIATWLTLMCEVRRGAVDQVAALAAQLRSITEEGALASGEGASLWFLGLAQAWSGQPVEGHALIDRAYRHNLRVGMLHGTPEVLGYAAEASMLAGEWARAARQAEAGLELAARVGDRACVAQLMLAKRRCLLAVGAAQDADAAARQALSEARRQRSPWLEMAVLVDLCGTLQPHTEYLDALRGVLASMPEPSSAPLMTRARLLLDRSDRLLPF